MSKTRKSFTVTKSFLNKENGTIPRDIYPEEFNVLLKLTENELTLLYAVLRNHDPMNKLPITMKIKDTMYVFERKN